MSTITLYFNIFLPDIVLSSTYIEQTDKHETLDTYQKHIKSPQGSAGEGDTNEENKMKLFEVTIKFFCVAENEFEAESFHYLDGTDIEAVEAMSAPLNWMDAIPFGHQNDDKTVKEYLTGSP